MSKALARLIDNIHLEKIEINIFRGVTLDSARGRVFGGQVLAQSINAAQRTVASPLVMHSLHAYFLRPGDPDTPIIYQVDRIRDGRSFTTRSVVAIQHGRPIFNVSMSFQLREQGIEHQARMPDVPPPEELISDEVYYREVHSDLRLAQFEWPIEFRQVQPLDLIAPVAVPPKAYVWFRAVGHIADDHTQHQELLAYATDHHILNTALRPHGLGAFATGMQMASLDHVIWFHRDFRIDDWLLFELESTNAGHGRAFTRGNIFDREGRLVASAAQEGLVRYRQPGEQSDDE
jgi:acyl-CoA thioesterase-2